MDHVVVPRPQSHCPGAGVARSAFRRSDDGVLCDRRRARLRRSAGRHPDVRPRRSAAGCAGRLPRHGCRRSRDAHRATGSLPRARLVEKQRAGASLAVLNHVSSATALSAFMGDARSAGLRIPVLAAVAVFTDDVSAAVLQGLPGLELDPALVDGVVNAPDPVEAGIEAAVTEARKLMQISGIHGVNLRVWRRRQALGEAPKSRPRSAPGSERSWPRE